MKKLLLLISVFAAHLSFAQWTPTSTSISTAIGREGFVGIGKINPLAPLHVHGRAYFGNGYGLSGWSPNNGSLVVIDWVHQANWGNNQQNWAGFIGFNAERYNGSQPDWYKGLSQSTAMGAIEFGYKGFRFMMKSSNGNNNNTSHKLDEVFRISTNGITYAKEINVSLANTWPDFVFAKDYDLMSLTETAKFIEKNHHLPGIPKAEILDTAGVNLGEMQRLQMMKIEELTLHLIAMAKENQTLKAELDEVKEKQQKEIEMIKSIVLAQEEKKDKPTTSKKK